jgi:hypothetical protein
MTAKYCFFSFFDDYFCKTYKNHTKQMHKTPEKALFFVVLYRFYVLDILQLFSLPVPPKRIRE